MTIEDRISKVFKFDEEVWFRHTNPLSVYSRFSGIPLLGIAFWSRVWLGWWSVLPITLVLFWLWLNPRIFPKPKSTNNWAGKAVLGERVWMNRKRIPVPNQHQILPNILSLISLLGMIFFIWGLYQLILWPTIFGGFVSFFSKLWFCDRMVWLYEDMKHLPEYNKWLY
ncbi:MAG: DUF6653 family protein [candidate division WOR-3 bacterium]